MALISAADLLWLLVVPIGAFAHSAGITSAHITSARPSTQSAAPLLRADMFKRSLRDLQRSDWEPLSTSPRWCNPCFFTSTFTAVSVWRAANLGLFPIFGLGPLLVLLSSLLHWTHPLRTSWRRSVDLATTRIGMSSQVLLALLHWQSGLLPGKGVAALLVGYAAAVPCYAAGRVLTVQGRRVLGAWVHGGLHLFSNLGNLFMLGMVLAPLL